jgi:hypothetical protein
MAGIARSRLLPGCIWRAGGCQKLVAVSIGVNHLLRISRLQSTEPGVHLEHWAALPAKKRSESTSREFRGLLFGFITVHRSRKLVSPAAAECKPVWLHLRYRGNINYPITGCFILRRLTDRHDTTVNCPGDRKMQAEGTRKMKSIVAAVVSRSYLALDTKF